MPSDTEAIIRTTTRAHAPQLPDVERSAAEAFRSAAGLEWLVSAPVMSVETHERFIAEGTSWVAEAGGAAVGFVCAEAVEGDLHVWELAVCQDRQGRGIGRRLMARAIDHARDCDLRSVTLTTFRGVPWNEPFYATLGFETLRVGETDPRLESILAREVDQGLPGERRCAMRLRLRQPPGAVES